MSGPNRMTAMWEIAIPSLRLRVPLERSNRTGSVRHRMGAA